MLIFIWKRLEYLSLKTNASLEGKASDANLFLACHISNKKQWDSLLYDGKTETTLLE